jgi:hypothetical protein
MLASQGCPLAQIQCGLSFATGHFFVNGDCASLLMRGPYAVPACWASLLLIGGRNKKADSTMNLKPAIHDGYQAAQPFAHGHAYANQT